MSDEAKTYKIGEIPLSCPICKNITFWKADAVIKSSFESWAPGRDAYTLTCEKCHHVLWFEL